jgi:hypothetical protein
VRFAVFEVLYLLKNDVILTLDIFKIIARTIYFANS